MENKPRIAIACQGGGAHTAFTAGVLRGLLADDRFDYMGFSGTSGGAICATIAWYGVAKGDKQLARERLKSFWEANSANSFLAKAMNDFTVQLFRLGSYISMPNINPNQLPNTGQPLLEKLLNEHIDFDDFDRVTKLGGPRLLIGAVDAVNGNFDLFEQFESKHLKKRISSVSSKAILASAAIPTIFPAVHLNGKYYWDGLFSQNPPVLDFLKDIPGPERPQQIWIIRINPQKISKIPTEIGQIMDRRNQLGGNLSLNQELETIESVRRVLIAAGVPKEKIPRVYVLNIQMPFVLDYATKLERSPAFINKLMSSGEEEANKFLENYETAIQSEMERIAELEKTIQQF